MATIIEGALWPVTKEVAELMAQEGFIKECKADEEHKDLLPVDKPVYHIHPQAPDWFGFTTIPGSIRLAQQHLESLS